MLQGADARGAVTWLVTNLRLLMLRQSEPDADITMVCNAAITCVEQRSDPVGTWLRVRSTGRTFTLTDIDPVQASHFCSVLRERAGIGTSQPSTPHSAGAPTPRRAATRRDPMRTGFTGLIAQSPR